MIEYVAFAALVASDLQEVIRVDVLGREMTGLGNREDVFRGDCDGQPAAATITKACRGRRGRLVLSAGPLTREVAPSFLNGRLFAESLYAAGIACDGQSLQFRALVARTNGRGDVVLDVQSVTMHLVTGELVLAEPRTIDSDETRSELR